AADEAGEIVEQRRQRLVGTVVVALAPAGDAVVGVDRDDHARAVLVARHEGAQAVDPHRENISSALMPRPAQAEGLSPRLLLSLWREEAARAGRCRRARSRL